MMTKIFMVFALLLIWAPDAFGQKATEQYIPIGKSPGLAGQILYSGSVREANEEARTLTFRDSGGTHVVQVTKKTKIWVDRTGSRRTNLAGRYRDCRVGRKVEVKFVDPDRRQAAEWIKVRGE